MTLLYREIEAPDVPELFRIRTKTRENRVSMEWLARMGITPESVRRSIEDNVRGWVCEDSGKIAGFVMGDGNTGEMLVIALLPEYEGRGIGNELMTRVQDWLFTRGHAELWLTANPDPAVRAHGFYRKLGWRAVEGGREGEEVMKLTQEDARL
jgi:ribosomal protein S18 acetylase RimI-like enzyme